MKVVYSNLRGMNQPVSYLTVLTGNRIMSVQPEKRAVKKNCKCFTVVPGGEYKRYKLSRPVNFTWLSSK